MKNEVKYRGYIIKIINDSNPKNPIERFDNLGKFIFFKNYSVLSNKNENNKFSTVESFIDFIKRDKAFYLPIYIDANTNSISHLQTNPLDNYLIGWVYINKQKIINTYQVSRITKNIINLVKETIIREIEDYNNYLMNNTFGYQITPINNNEHIIYEEFGYYGDDFKSNKLKNNAKLFIDTYIKTRLSNRLDRFKKEIQEKNIYIENHKLQLVRH